MNWFNGCSTPDDVRAEYRRLAKQHHPDLGGDTRTMQGINAAYEAAMKAKDGREFKRTKTSDDGGQTWTYYYNEQQEQEIREAIDRILGVIRNRPDVTLTLVGLWLWVVGNTRPIKDDLRAIGCYWNSKREAWNWKPATAGRSYYNKNVSLSDILAEGSRVTAAAENARRIA